MHNILEVKNLIKQYPGFAIDNISFELPKGYITGFIGPNGAGKTTTIKLLMNLVKRDDGEIKIFGLDSIKNEVEIKERIGFVYDEGHFYDELNAIETKRIIAPFYKRWDDQQFNYYLDKFELPVSKKVKEFSKGMKMKLALALALSHQAELIIMDEPTSGLDPVFRNDILDILRELMQDEEKAILFSTHITTDLEKVADYVIFINKGQLVFGTSREAVMEKYAVIKGGTDLLDHHTRKQFIGIRQNSFGFEALTTDIERVQNIFGNNIIVQRATLEDIMLYTVRGKGHA